MWSSLNTFIYLTYCIYFIVKLRWTVCGCGERCSWQCCTPSADNASTGQPQLWGWRISDALGSFYHSLQYFLVQDSAVVIPYWGAVGKVALSGVAVEVPENLREQMDLLQSPQEEDTLVSILEQDWSVDGPRAIFRDVDIQILKTDDTLNRSPLIWIGACVSCVSFLMFSVLRARLLLVHHAARWPTTIDNSIRTLEACSCRWRGSRWEDWAHILWNTNVQGEGHRCSPSRAHRNCFLQV